MLYYSTSTVVNPFQTLDMTSVDTYIQSGVIYLVNDCTSTHKRIKVVVRLILPWQAEKTVWKAERQHDKQGVDSMTNSPMKIR